MPLVGLPQITMDSSDFKTKTGNWRRGFGSVHKELMADAATYWHHRLFPGHFTPGNESRYQMESRTPAYLKRKRMYGTGQGRYVANVFSGASFRRMMSLFKVTATAASGTQQATLRMSAPTYFAKPAVGTFTDANGRRFTIKKQPDKVKEVTQMNDRDEAELKRYMQQRYQQLIEKYINKGTSLAKAA